MTTFTDAELDALIAEIHFEAVNSEIDRSLAGRICITLTYLRAQLAERDALGAVVMRERAAMVAVNFGTASHIAHSIKTGNFPEQTDIRDAISDAIRALPIPTHAELLAAALELPEIKALVKACTYLDQWDCCWPGNINLETAKEIATAALAAIEQEKLK